MKLVIKVKEEDYKRYKEDKICSYTSAVLDAVPLNEVLDKIRAEINNSSHGKWYVGRLDGKTEEVLLLDEVSQIIDKYREEQE